MRCLANEILFPAAGAGAALRRRRGLRGLRVTSRRATPGKRGRRRCLTSSTPTAAHVGRASQERALRVQLLCCLPPPGHGKFMVTFRYADAHSYPKFFLSLQYTMWSAHVTN